MLENVLHVRSGRLVHGNMVHFRIDVVAPVRSATHGSAVEGIGTQGAVSGGPVDELAEIREEDARGRRVGRRGLLRLDLHDGIDEGALVYAARSADDSVGKSPEILKGFSAYDHNALLGRYIFADQDGDSGLAGRGTEGQVLLGQA